MSLHVAAYDISDDKQRDRVARVLSSLGERVQRSVFVVWLDSDDLPELKQQIGALLSKSDSFDLFPLDHRVPERRISWQREVTSWQPVIVCE